MIKTIIFDLGNVIVKVYETKVFRRLASASGKNLKYIEEYYNNSYKALENGAISSMELHAKFVKDLNLKMNFEEFKKAWCDIFSLNKDVEKVIKKLKKDFRLILLSNTDNMRFQYIKNKYKILDAFDDYVLSFEVGCRKPNPLIFLNAIKKANTLPFNCAYFDDIPEFIYVARLMGIKAFQFKDYKKLVDDLRKLDIKI